MPRSHIGVAATEHVVLHGLAAILDDLGPIAKVRSLPKAPGDLSLLVVHEGLLDPIDPPGCLRDLAGRLRPCPVLPFASWTDMHSWAMLAQAGGLGVLVSTETDREIRSAARDVLKGKPHLPHALAMELAHRTLRPLAAPRVTPRELDIIRLAAAGRSNTEIADELYISIGTVKTTLSRLFVKLEVPNRGAAIAKLAALGVMAGGAAF